MKNDKSKEYSNDFETEHVVSKVSSLFDELDSNRQKQKNDIRNLEDAIFLKSPDKFQMTDIFELYQTFKAHIWENLYSNLDLLFDVKGQSSNSDKLAPLQKNNLLHYFENAKLQNVLDDAIDFLIKKSEAIVFVGWRTSEKVTRRKVLSKIDQKNQIVIKTEKNYDGLDLKAIDPENIVFDTDKQKYFIYQTYINPSDLDNQKTFNLLDENMLLEIKNYSSQKNIKHNKGIVDDKIELLEYWGDFKLPDGSVLRNQVIVVAARKFLIRLENNPYIINPFVVMNLLQDPDTKRGFLYLKTALPMKEKSQQIFINQLRALEFITNPAYLAPKGAFSSSNQDAQPGKIIEYEPSLMPQTPIPLNMSGALQGWDFLNYLKSIEETTTGVFRNFASVIDKSNRSATEVQATVGGQNSRLSMIIDQINQYLIIPIVEKSAELIANLIFDEEKILINVDNNSVELTINDEVRSADYQYVYGDRNSMQLRKLKAREMFEVCVNLFKVFPELKNSINPENTFKFVLEQYGFDNFERFKNNELPCYTNGTANLSGSSNDQKTGMGNI